MLDPHFLLPDTATAWFLLPELELLTKQYLLFGSHVQKCPS